MVTTIQIKESTKELLQKIKQQANVKTYDDAIVKLYKQQPKKSMAGYLTKWKTLTMNEILEELWDERRRE